VTPTETLQHIQQRLTHESPSQIIEAMLPQTSSGALTWARRLSGWGEYPFPAQVIGLARVISQRSMREFGLKLSEDGRVVDQRCQPGPTGKPEWSFRLAVAGEELSVKYRSDYFPGIDLVSFVADKPHGLSATGHLAQFVPHDVIDACGGPEAFAAQFAEATLQGNAQEFMAAFKGKSPEPKRHQPAKEQAVGGHTTRVIGEAESSPATDAPSVQRLLF